MLGTELGRLYNHYYEITPEGNFEGKSIPNLVRRLPPAESEKELGEARERLFHAREQRVHPHKDDKVLTSWNGLMIAALDGAARLLQKGFSLEEIQQTIKVEQFVPLIVSPVTIATDTSKTLPTSWRSLPIRKSTLSRMRNAGSRSLAITKTHCAKMG